MHNLGKNKICNKKLRNVYNSDHKGGKKAGKDRFRIQVEVSESII